MVRTTDMHSFTAVLFDSQSAMPLHRQLYESLRQAILTGQLGTGMKLPSTRKMADHLGVSRNTVLNAFDQLIAEGYLDGVHGSGTFVARELPERLLTAPAPPPRGFSDRAQAGRALSKRGIEIASLPLFPAPMVPEDRRKSFAFRQGVPALEEFPLTIWKRLQGRHINSSYALNYQADYRPLREAIAGYLGTSRGVQCTADQVLLVGGSQHGLDIISRVLLDPGDAVWFENPGYSGARGALVAAGAKLVPVPVDDEGLDVHAGQTRCPDARLVFITPSHQFPLGSTMSLRRRLSLLEWAYKAQAWIIEDDYDSEYRYSGRPLAALQGLDHQHRVIYLGTFSKVLFPGLRLGYLVVPPDLVDAFFSARFFSMFHPPVLDQMTLTDFITEGHFERHIRRMRALYEARQTILVEAAQRNLTGLLEVEPADTGMHLMGWLPDGVDGWTVAQQAGKEGVDTFPLAGYCLEPYHRSGLVLGYTAVNKREIETGVKRLANALGR